MGVMFEEYDKLADNPGQHLNLEQTELSMILQLLNLNLFYCNGISSKKRFNFYNLQKKCLTASLYSLNMTRSLR